MLKNFFLLLPPTLTHICIPPSYRKTKKKGETEKKKTHKNECNNKIKLVMKKQSVHNIHHKLEKKSITVLMCVTEEWSEECASHTRKKQNKKHAHLSFFRASASARALSRDSFRSLASSEHRNVNITIKCRNERLW